MLLSLRGADVELREQYGKCFGELGAIDPGKYVSGCACIGKKRVCPPSHLLLLTACACAKLVDIFPEKLSIILNVYQNINIQTKNSKTGLGCGVACPYRLLSAFTLFRRLSSTLSQAVSRFFSSYIRMLYQMG